MTRADEPLRTCNTLSVSLLVVNCHSKSSPVTVGKMVGLVRFELTRPTMVTQKTQHDMKTSTWHVSKNVSNGGANVGPADRRRTQS